ncbi:hypothetical protein BGZ96_009925 [Linnemannia gamsii]|uniref:Crinkler effector protein N-terminal domain-containing protein n=1 Tax=Linnemannia gamsii TaxID=64522 RepID=A0ABQ7JVG6_9FUNG|nr:hypothetical protein BGZ96_009925 [Linnemannia gamsii]
MSEKYVIFFCLVDGEDAANAFPVEIECTKTISDLTKRIKFEKALQFDDIAAEDLTLWRVSISVAPASMYNPIVLSEVAGLPQPAELVPTSDVSEVLPKNPPTDTIHILVQLPPQVHAPVHNRDSSPLLADLSKTPSAATPMQLKIFRYGDTNKALASVPKAAEGRHIVHDVDPKDVETSLKEKPSPSKKRSPPYRSPVPDVCLVMLGLLLDKQPKTSDSKTLRAIVEHDVGSADVHSVVAMVAPSGSGKTATVFDLSSKHFVIYFVCCSQDSNVSPTFKDPNFATLAKDVEDIYKNVANKEQRTLYDLLDLDSEVKRLIEERVQLEVLARLLFLQLLQDNNADLEPQEFFLDQTTPGGAMAISKLVKMLRCCSSRTIDSMLQKAQIKLHALLSSKGRGLVIALDDSQVAVNDILAGRLISEPALVNNRDALLDDKDQIKSKFRRGFFSPLSATLSDIQATLVILGTAVSLQEADDVYSSIAERTNFIRITEFAQFDADDVNRMLSDLVDLSDVDIPLAKRHKLTGRPRFSLGIVNRLLDANTIQETKQVILNNAVDYAIEHEMGGFQTGIRTLLEDDKSGDIARLSCRMVLAYLLQETSIWFSSSRQLGLVEKSLCRLRPDQCDIYLVMDEPMVVDAVEAELKALGKDFALIEHLDQVEKIVANFGVETSRRNILELLVCRSLQRFNGVRLVDLPFLKDISLPSWCDDFRLQIDEINTADGLGCTTDLDFLVKCPPNKMLVAKESGTRPGGVWFFSDKRYAGFLVVNLYSEPVPNYIHERNEASSDVRTCFLKTAGTTINPSSLADVRRSFEDSGTPSRLKGILRIHLEFPGVQGLWNKPVTYIKKDPTSGVEDVMVHFNLANMDSFFDEDIPENRDDVIQLKQLINLVSSSK